MGQRTKSNASNVAHTLGVKDRLAHPHVLPVFSLLTGTSVAPAASKGGRLVYVVDDAMVRWIDQRDPTEQDLLDIAIALDDTIVESTVTVDVAQTHMLLAETHLWFFVLAQKSAACSSARVLERGPLQIRG